MPETNYFWDELEDNVVREYDENNNTIASYSTEPTLYGSVLSQDRGGAKRNFQFDGLGNTTELTDAEGAVTDSRRYSAFGDVVSDSGITVLSYLYGAAFGYQSDFTTTLIYIRRRFYAARYGLWTSADPLSPSATVAAYTYAMSRPIRMCDADGCQPTYFGNRFDPFFENTLDIPEVTLDRIDCPPRPQHPRPTFPPNVGQAICDLTWMPTLCPDCPCHKSVLGHPDPRHCDLLLQDAKRELTHFVPPACRSRVELRRFTCEETCAGVPHFAVTCRKLRDGKLRLGMCIPSSRSICTAKALIVHELVHAREFIQEFCLNTQIGTRPEQEYRAYAESCMYEAEQSCLEFSNPAWIREINTCIRNGVIASTRVGPDLDHACARYLI